MVKVGLVESTIDGETLLLSRREEGVLGGRERDLIYRRNNRKTSIL